MATVHPPQASPPPPPPPPPSTQASVPSRNFVFINDTYGDEAKSKAKRKIVRAQAARGPHSNTLNGSKAELNSQTVLSRHQQIKKSKKATVTTTFPLNVVGIDDVAPALPPTDRTKKEKDHPVLVRVEDKGLEAGTDQKEPRHSSDSSTSTALQRSSPNDEQAPSSSGSTVGMMRKMPGSVWGPPFLPCPDPKRPYIPALIDHYLCNMAVAIPELDADVPRSLHKVWFPMVITNPATLYVVLLTAASHYAAFNQFLHKPTVQRVLLDLKHATLSSINQLIRDTPPGHPMSDQTIAAVAKMASYEAMFGSPSLCHTHMRGLQSMVQARGGLEAMTGLGGFMMRMVMWIDINSAFLIGGAAYFRPTSQPLAGHVALVPEMEPNPAHFLSQGYRGEE